MPNFNHIRTIDLLVTILRDTGHANSCLSESTRRAARTLAYDLLDDLADRSSLSSIIHDDLMEKVSDAYIGGDV